ncbi:MAG: response regulator [Thermodesulfobacteriota bacterium]
MPTFRWFSRLTCGLFSGMSFADHQTLPATGQYSNKERAAIRNIFVWEEEPVLRDKLVDSLRNEECRVVSPTDFSEATEAVTQEIFDLILCDYWMRKTDGVAFFNLIRDLQKTAVKVLMAGYPTGLTKSDLRRAGIDHLIKKPAAFECVKTLMEDLAHGKPRSFRPMESKTKGGPSTWQ